MNTDLRDLTRQKLEARDKYDALAMTQRPPTMEARIDLELQLQAANVAYQKASNALYDALAKARARP